MTQIITIYFNSNSRKTYDYLLVNNTNKVKTSKNKGFFLTTPKGISGVFVVGVQNVSYIPDHVYTIFEVVDNKHAKTAPLSQALRNNYNTLARTEDPEKYKYQSKQQKKDLERLIDLQKFIQRHQTEANKIQDKINFCKKYGHPSLTQRYRQELKQHKQIISEYKQEVREIKQRLALYK